MEIRTLTFVSADPFDIVMRAKDREHFEAYIAQPQNWNRFAYVWNNPLRFIDPNGEAVYVVAYTYGNQTGGDEEFRIAAETRAAEIRKSKGFDAQRDTVLVQGVKSRDDLRALIAVANSLDSAFGQIQSLTFFSHGTPSGPTFRERPGGAEGVGQFSQKEIEDLQINFSPTATAAFYSCRSGAGTDSFAARFANAQGVVTYGFQGYLSPSTVPDMRVVAGPGTPRSLYFVDGPSLSNGNLSTYMLFRPARPAVRFGPR